MFRRKEGPPVSIGMTEAENPPVPEKLKQPHRRIFKGLMAYRADLRARREKQEEHEEVIHDETLAIQPGVISEEIRDSVLTGETSIDASHPSPQILYLHSPDEDHIVILPEPEEGMGFSETDLDRAVSYRITTRMRTTMGSLKNFLHKHWIEGEE